MKSIVDENGLKKVYFATTTVLGKKFRLCFADTGGLVVSLNQTSLQQLAFSVPLFLFWKQAAQTPRIEAYWSLSVPLSSVVSG